MKCGIVVDNWKLPVFRKQLTAAGYEYSEVGALTANTSVLTVEANDMLALEKLLRTCQAECRRNT